MKANEDEREIPEGRGEAGSAVRSVLSIVCRRATAGREEVAEEEDSSDQEEAQRARARVAAWLNTITADKEEETKLEEERRYFESLNFSGFTEKITKCRKNLEELKDVRLGNVMEMFAQGVERAAETGCYLPLPRPQQGDFTCSQAEITQQNEMRAGDTTVINTVCTRREQTNNKTTYDAIGFVDRVVTILVLAVLILLPILYRCFH